MGNGKQISERKKPRAVVGPPRVIPRLALLGSRSSVVFLVALGVTSLAFHTWLAARTVTGDDSGELITAAATGGVAHPPGYPLWTMLGRLFSLLPVGEVAFRVTLVSCVFAALTSVTLAAIALVLSGSRTVAAATGLGFALLREPWCQAEIAEVYTLGTFQLASTFLGLQLPVWVDQAISLAAWSLFAPKRSYSSGGDP